MPEQKTKPEWRRTLAALTTFLLITACSTTTTVDFEPLETAKETKAKAPPPPNFLPQEETQPVTELVRETAATPAVPQQQAETTSLPPSAPSTENNAKAVREEELAAIVEAWRSAWAERNIDDYLAFYLPNFKGYAASPEAWRASRKLVLSARGSLEIRLSALNIAMVDNERAEVTFDQYYRSTRLTDNGRKLLVLVRRDGRWLIEQESFTPNKP